MDEKSTRHDIKEVLRETKVWRPLGKDSKTRIVADTFGTAGVGTVSIHAACELHPDEARAIVRTRKGIVTGQGRAPALYCLTEDAAAKLQGRDAGRMRV